MPREVMTIDQWLAEMPRLAEQDRAKAEEAMFIAAHLTRNESVRQIGLVEPFVPVDTGLMRGSYRVERVAGGAVVENTAPHAAVMEYGRKPGNAPWRPLFEWAMRKSRGSTAPGESREKAAGRLAAAAQRAIKRRGIIGRGFHEAAIRQSGEFLRRALRAVGLAP